MDIGVSEVIKSNVNNNSVEHSSVTLSETVRTPLSETHSNIETLVVGNEIGSCIEQVKVVDLVIDVTYDDGSLNLGNDIGSRIEQVKFDDFISDSGYNSDQLDVGNDISFRIEQVKVNNYISDSGYNSDLLDVGNDISSRIEQVKVNDVVSDVTCDSDSMYVFNDIITRIRQFKVEEFIDLGNDDIPSTSKGTVSSMRRQRPQMAVAGRKASVLSRSDVVD
ncbi:unnamed protein product [Peronospora farinosa]|uniref:Uncharacterized protein n=1 Tax=Peronospora farinosa TaxID=134698 RepID=A0AAV0T6E8_9STRA|nr:unnamed protein product [Peronospora farinosa]